MIAKLVKSALEELLATQEDINLSHFCVHGF